MQCMMEILYNLNSLFWYQIAIPCLDLILNRLLIMDTILLLYESIIAKVNGTLFMCWYLLMVAVLFHVAQILPYFSCTGF